MIVLLDESMKDYDEIKKQFAYHNVNVKKNTSNTLNTLSKFHKIENNSEKEQLKITDENNKLIGVYSSVSEYIVKNFYFKIPSNMCYHPQTTEHVISFNNVNNITNLFITYNLHKYEFVNKILDTLLFEGIYFMSPHNKRVKINWCPGLTGIPYTKKQKDAMHELTYLFHDICHHTIRTDVLFSGSHSKLKYKIYIISRMLSEAVSLVLADMIFVSYLLKEQDYKTLNDRKIFPMYEHSSINVNNINLNELVNKIKQIIIANSKYAIVGNDSYLKDLFGDNIQFSEYKEKYSQFYIKDIQWTHHNYLEMLSKSQSYVKWVKNIQKINTKYSLGLITSDEIICKLNLSNEMTDDELLDKLLSETFIKIEQVLLDQKIKTNTKYTFPIRDYTEKAFMRYACNQLFAIHDDELVDKLYSENVSDILINELLNLLTNDDIVFAEKEKEFNDKMNEYFYSLKEIKKITLDDYLTYKELYSPICPKYVNYDDKSLETLKDVCHKILSFFDSH